jgi:ribosomal protein S18 acetylase RimI-like enzyme
MIRQAIPGDAPKVVPLILDAIGSIAFILSGTTERKEAASILDGFFREEGNRVSYQNTLVLEEDGQVVGIALIYDGAKARELDQPLERTALEKSGIPDYRIPTEPDESEFYLDTVSVSPSCQGKGYGRKLIEAACLRAREQGHHRIALLVDLANTDAKRLYERLGFSVDRTKSIGGEEYFQMVRGL